MTQIEPALLWLAGICGAVLSIWGVITKLTQPHKDLEARVTRLEDRVESNESRLTSDHKSLQEQEGFNRIVLESLGLMLEHEATGNHTVQLQHQADKVHEYLYDKAGKLK